MSVAGLSAVWSAKGGVGTTVVSFGVAHNSSERLQREVLLVDLGGDLPAVLGLPDPTFGLTDWLAAGDDASISSLARLERSTPTNGVSLLPRGFGAAFPRDRVGALLGLLTTDDRQVIVDVGVPGCNGESVEFLQRSLIDAAQSSLLVTRPCYLALRRALHVGHRPTGVILVQEPHRSLERDDVEAVIGVPVVAVVGVDRSVSRGVDAGTLAANPPRLLLKPLRRVA